MSAYKDHRDLKRGVVTWRYRDRMTLPDGSKTRIKGTPTVVGLPNTQKGAEQAEDDHKARLRHPELLARKPEPAPDGPCGGMTVAKFAPTHLEQYKPAQSDGTAQSRKSLIDGARGVVEFFGTYPLADLNQAPVDAFVRAQLKAKVSTRTINRKLTALSCLIDHAVKLSAVTGLTKRPLLELFIKEHGETEHRAYTDVEVEALLKAADQRYRVAVLLGADAGLRIGEIRGLQWTDIKAGVLQLKRSINPSNVTGPLKSKRARAVPMSNRLRAEVSALSKRGLYVLTRLADDTENLRGEARKRASAPGGFLGYFGMLGAMHRMMKAAKIEQADDLEPWHSLRHYFGTTCAARGVQRDELQKLMGHESYLTTERYITTTPARLADAIDRAFNR